MIVKYFKYIGLNIQFLMNANIIKILSINIKKSCTS